MPEKARKPATHAEALTSLAAPEAMPKRALKALSDLDEIQLTDTLQVWRDLPDNRRADVAEQLNKLLDEDIEVEYSALFRALLADEDPRVRLAAIEGLDVDENVANVDPLVRLMRLDASEDVRAAAAHSLGAYLALAELGKLSAKRRDTVYSALTGVWLSEREFTDVRRSALESLGYVSNPAVETLVADAYQSEDDDVRISAVTAMGHSSDNQYLDIVLKELLSVNEDMRVAAAAACGEIEIPEAVTLLSTLIDRDDAMAPRLAAIDALSFISTQEAQRALERAAASEEEEIAEAAEEALDAWEALNGDIDMPAFDA